MKLLLIATLALSTLACKNRPSSKIKNSAFTKTTEFVKLGDYFREVVVGLTPLQLRNPSNNNECFIRSRQGFFLCDGTPHFVIDKWHNKEKSIAQIRFMPGPNELCLNEAHYIPEGGEKSVQEDSFYLGRCDSESAKIRIVNQSGSVRLGSRKHSDPLVVDLYAPIENPSMLATKILDWPTYTPSMTNWDENQSDSSHAYTTINQLLFGPTQSGVRYTGMGPTLPKNLHTTVEIEANGYDGLDSNKVNWYANSEQMQQRCEEWCDAYANMQCETWYRVKSSPGFFKRLYATCSLDANYSTNSSTDFLNTTASDFSFFYYKNGSKNLRQGNIQRLAKVVTKYKTGNTSELGCGDSKVCPPNDLEEVKYNVESNGNIKYVYLLKDNDFQAVGSVVLETTEGRFFLANNKSANFITNEQARQLGIRSSKSPEEDPPAPQFLKQRIYSTSFYPKRTYPKNDVCVTAFLHTKFRGKSFKFCQSSSPSQADFSEWNNQISSIRFDGNARVQVFDNQNFSGNSKVLTQSVANLKDRSFSMNDTISSVKFLSPSANGYKALPTILNPFDTFSRGEKQLMNKMGAIIPEVPSLSCAQLEAKNNQSTLSEFELTKYATKMSKAEYQNCISLKYKLSGFYGLTNAKGILSMGATFQIVEQPDDNSGYFKIKPPTDSKLEYNQAKETPIFGQYGSNPRQPSPDVRTQKNMGRRFKQTGSFNENSSLGFSRIKEIRWSWDTQKVFNTEFNYISGLSFVVDSTSMGGQNVDSSEETIHLLATANPNSENFKINTDLEELGLCRVEYLPFPKGTEYIRDPSKPGNRYAKKTIVASVYPNSGSIYGLRLYFAPKVNGAWDNNSSARRVITLKGTDGARDDFISDNMERVQTQWKRVFPVNENVGSFCSTSSTNEVTGFRAETADTWSGVKSKADGRITTEATIPRVISSMKFYYGTRQE